MTKSNKELYNHNATKCAGIDANIYNNTEEAYDSLELLEKNEPDSSKF